MKNSEKKSKQQNQIIIKWASNSSNSIKTELANESISEQLKKVVTRELDKIIRTN